MGKVPFSHFIGSRVRFQRLCDQQVFSGWLERLDEVAVEVAAEEPLPIEASERFLFQVQGSGSDAYFIASCERSSAQPEAATDGATAREMLSCPGPVYEFRPVTEIQLRQAQQQARKAIATMAATLSARDVLAELLIVDASANGMGAIAWQEFRRGDVVDVDVESAGTGLSFSCEVRHCRPEPRLIGAYRIGLQFRNPDPDTLDAWGGLLGDGS